MKLPTAADDFYRLYSFRDVPLVNGALPMLDPFDPLRRAAAYAYVGAEVGILLTRFGYAMATVCMPLWKWDMWAMKRGL